LSTENVVKISAAEALRIHHYVLFSGIVRILEHWVYLCRFHWSQSFM